MTTGSLRGTAFRGGVTSQQTLRRSLYSFTGLLACTSLPPPAMKRFRPLLLLLLASILHPSWGGSPVAGQDVELLGRIYGTRPPDAYFELRRQQPEAFEFQRALLGPRDRALLEREQVGFGLLGVPPLSTLGSGVPFSVVLGPRVGQVAGRFRFPVILGLYADSPQGAGPVASEAFQREYFDGPSSSGLTIAELYDEMSGGRVQLEGATFDWVRTTLTRAEVGGGVAGLTNQGRVGNYIFEVLAALDAAGVDWGQFDNDGPDGIPNSGDDDGFVDILAVIHPTRGAECSADRNANDIWSHRWTLQARMGQHFVTSTPSASGGNIKINDYTIQSAISCDTTQGARINEIGIFAHELGHGFGLPDLYRTSGGTGPGGVGNWDLMGTGAWGCSGGNPARPCHMGAWTKAVLGWVDIRTLDTGVDHGEVTLPPVVTAGEVLQLPAGDGSGEFFLLENRQRLGSDESLPAPGLLVWHVTPATVASNWPSNSVNNSLTRPGVWLRQADGRDDLTQGQARGDAGDPFPGSTGNRSFHAGSNPGSVSRVGTPTGVTLLGITQVGEEVRFRVLNRFQEVTLALEADGAAGPADFLVDGRPVAPGEAFLSAPFQSHAVQAPEGLPVAEGTRVPFQGWGDGAPRSRTLVTSLRDSTFTAAYQGLEHRVAVNQEGGAPGVAPGQVEVLPSAGGGWATAGSTVTVTAVPRTGFAFLEWAGALAGASNPAVLTVDAPVIASALYRMTYSTETPPVVTIQAARPEEVVLRTANGNPPVRWSVVSGTLPPGLSMSQGGVISGAALESGGYPLEVRAVDAIGLTATAGLHLAVAPPVIPLDRLASPFVLAGEPPTEDQLRYLDHNGNENGYFDLGDLRAFLLAHPATPAAASAAPAATEPQLLPPLPLQREFRP